MTWVNILLSQRFFKEAIPKIFGKTNEIRVESSVLENLGNLSFDYSNELESDNYISTLRKIRRYVEIDPKGIFRQTQIKKYPQANFREIAIKRWSGISWKDISDDLSIPVATLSNFYQRTLEQFRDEFRDLCGVEDLT